MSAFGVGARSPILPAKSAGETRAQRAEARVAASEPDDDGPTGKFVKWIPGDALTFYASLLTIGISESTTSQDSSTPDPLQTIDESSFGWFAFALFAAVALVTMGALGKRRRKRSREAKARIAIPSLVVRAILTAVAFTLWASVLPHSWPNGLKLVQDIGPAYPAVIAVVAAMFTFVAEGATNRFSL